MMNRNTAAWLLRFAAENKRDIMDFLEGLDEDCPERGRISIRDGLLQDKLSELIYKRAGGTASDFDLVFDDGYIFASVKIRKLMTVSVSAALEIRDFQFDAGGHRIFCTYNLLGPSVKNRAIEEIVGNLAKKNDLTRRGVVIGANSVEICLDKLVPAGKLPDWLTLKYISCDEGRMNFKYEAYIYEIHN